MKGLYLTLLSLDGTVGYRNKIFGQVSAFAESGFEVRILSIGGGRSIVETTVGAARELESKVVRSFGKMPFCNRWNLFEAAKQMAKADVPEFVYVRYTRADPLYLGFLRWMKLNCPHVLTLSEIPTYPYDHIPENFQTIYQRLLLWVDRICRRKFPGRLDRIVGVDCAGEVFGVPAVCINNGVDVSLFKLVRQPRSIGSTLKILGVANLMEYHGFDRVVAGIDAFQRSCGRTVALEFHVVGPRSVAAVQLEKLVGRCGLQAQVKFHAATSGPALDALFDECHVAVGTLGWHRIGVKRSSTLKSREYMARGIPFVFSGDDAGIPSKFPFCWQIPADNGAVRISDLWDFVRNVFEVTEHPSRMRAYAAERMNWTRTMSNVISEIRHLVGARRTCRRDLNEHN